MGKLLNGIMLDSYEFLLQESGNRDDSVVDLLFQPEKCFISKSALQLMKLVHGALKVCLALHPFILQIY